MDNKKVHLRINAWDADPVVSRIQGIVIHCVEYLHQRCGAAADHEKFVRFLQSAVDCMNMYYPEAGPATRPSFQLETLTVLFDNGITANTDHDNYPKLYVSGIPYRELTIFEGDGIQLKPGDDFHVLIFKDNQYRYGLGLANVVTAIPGRLSAEPVLQLVSM